MSDPIQQIIQVHPEFENMQAKFEVEIGGLRQQVEELEKDKDEWQEKAEGADDCAYQEREFFEKAFKKYNPETNRDEDRKLTLTELKDMLEGRKKPRWEGDYGVLSSLEEYIDKIIPEKIEVKYQTEYVTKYVDKLPDEISINGKNYTSK